MQRRPGTDERASGNRSGLRAPVDQEERRRLRRIAASVALVGSSAGATIVASASGNLPWVGAGMAAPACGLLAGYAAIQAIRLRHTGRALSNERVLVASLGSRLEELSGLLDAGRAMNAGLELSEVLRRILDNALELLGATDGSVMLADEPGALRTVCVSGNDEARDSVVRFGEGIAGGVAERREPVIVQGGRRASAMSVPLVHRSGLLGVLNVNVRSGRTFDQFDLRALSLFAEHAASSIANARLFEAERDNAIALAHRSFHDSLTDLGNRELFADRLTQALGAERLRPIAVALLDLDDFKKVNDVHGHAFGDELLCRVADRLSSGLDDGALLARLGGDEFAVLLDDVRTADGALRAGEHLLDVISGPIELLGREVTVRASMGVVLAQPGVATTDEVLRNADVAMYIAKAQGKGCARLFEPAMHTALLERTELEAALEVAVERAQLDLAYDPIVSLATGRVSGFEALVHWNHPQRGDLPPSAFLPIAVDTGLIVPIDRWVLLKACCQAQAWQQAYPAGEPLVVAVNVSCAQLEEDDVVELVALALEVSKLPPQLLIIQVAASFLDSSGEAGVARLQALRKLGVRLAVDEFGMSHTSLSYLRHLPIDVLKIDRSCIDGLGRSDEHAALVQAILRLARSLHLETIAEGVVRPDQRATLADLQCGMAQGWHTSRPLRSVEMEDLLRSRAAVLPMGVL